MTSEARQYAARNRQGSDWFSHSNEPVSQSHVSAPPAPATSPTVASKTTPVSVEPTVQVSLPTVQQQSGDGVSAGDSLTPSGEQTGRTKAIRPVSDSNQWYKYDQKTASPADKTDNGDAYHQRGTASSWFSQDSGRDAGAAHQRGSSKELGANAARMRGESEQWFSHESSSMAASAASPGHSARGRANRPGNSSEMHDVFHHAGK